MTAGTVGPRNSTDTPPGVNEVSRYGPPRKQTDNPPGVGVTTLQP
jgi:hypothetical protein